MNSEIDEVITEDLRPAPVIIQGKTEIGKGPADISPEIKSLLNLLEVQRRKMDILIYNDVVKIIEMPFPLETVSIDKQQENEKAGSRKHGLSGKG